MIQTIQVKATEIRLSNTIVPRDNINIEIKHDYRVNYSEEGDKCRAMLKLGFVYPESPEELSILCTVVGEFSIDKVQSDDDKINTHLACYQKIFPYAQALIARLCVETGMPPFYCPEMPMDKSSVKVEK